MAKINPDYGRLQRIIFVDILYGSWQAYRSSKLTCAQLKEAGFKNVEIIRDKVGMFPTIIGYR